MQGDENRTRKTLEYKLARLGLSSNRIDSFSLWDLVQLFGFACLLLKL
jgi:hypothetical protein